MSIKELLDSGKIHSFDGKPEEITKLKEVAHRDLILAIQIQEESMDWAYSIAYNAILQACRAYMFSLGYRPSSIETHKVTIEFMLETIELRLKPMMEYFDRVRKKRHHAVYDEAGTISEKEIQYLISRAKEFIDWIDDKLRE